jgi:hypothetical protein
VFIDSLKIDMSLLQSKGKTLEFVAIAKETIEIFLYGHSVEGEYKEFVHTLLIKTDPRGVVPLDTGLYICRGRVGKCRFKATDDLFSVIMVF